MIFSFAAIAVLLLPGCGKHSSEIQQTDLPPAAVKVQTLGAQPRMATESVMGTVRSTTQANLEARLNARIESMPVTLGQRVKEGDVLVELDDADIRARLAQAEAVLAQASHDFERFSALLEKQAVSQSQFDDVQARHRVARAQVEEASSMLAHTKILAPFDGVITRKSADAGDMAAPGKPLLTIEDPAQLQFEADVPEALVSNIKIGDRMTMRVADGDEAVKGTVTEVAPAADSVSRTFLIKLRLPADAPFRSGQFGRVEIPAGESVSLSAPASAILKRGQMELMFVVDDNRAHLRLIKTGAHMGDDVEILSGVEPGETVVVEGAERLTDGQPVEAE